MDPHPDDHVIVIAATPIVTVSRRATLRQAAKALRTANIGALVVLPDHGKPLGIISERDVVRALADGANPDEVWAADIMTEEPRYITPAQTIRSATEEMLTVGVRHLPVIDEGEVVGMVAARDALRVLSAAVAERQLAR
ncbi:MAG TPA: CBS domain-containing protein [Acidimicrobiales bacterium]|nr:CBS domain-containing protein [Acidimicrobiales bacterium]